MAGEVATIPAEIIPVGLINPPEGDEPKVTDAVAPTIATLIIDPQIRSLIPPLSESEYAQLRESIKEYGCREPPTIWKGRNTLLDGHSRYEICKELDKPFTVVEVDLPDLNAAKIWRIENQNRHRYLKEPQRAMVAVKLEEAYAEQAKERKGARTDLDPNLDCGKFGRSAEKAAKEMGVSRQTVYSAKKVYKKGIPELAKIVLETGEVAISAAVRVAAFDAAIQAKIVERIEDEIKVGNNPKVATIIREVVPKEANDILEEHFKKVIQNLRACQKLLSDIDTASSPEMQDEILTALEEIKVRLKEIGAMSPDSTTSKDIPETRRHDNEEDAKPPETEPEKLVLNENAETDVEDDGMESADDDPAIIDHPDLLEEWDFYQDAMNRQEEDLDWW